MRTRRSAALLIFLLAAGCAGVGNSPPGEPTPTQTGGSQPAPHPLDAQQAERVRRIMAPLVAAMDHPRPLNQVKVGIMDDPHVNAASAGGESSMSPPVSSRRPATSTFEVCWPMSSPTTISVTLRRRKPWALDWASG
jgi:hypothetical protein